MAVTETPLGTVIRAPLSCGCFAGPFAVEREALDGALAIPRDAAAPSPMSADLRRKLGVLEDVVLLRTER